MRKHLTLAMLLLSASCATTNSLERGRGDVNFIVQNRTFDEVWAASMRVVSQKLNLIETDRASGVIKAEAPAGSASWGEVVGVYIYRSASPGGYHLVEVQTVKKSRAEVTGPDWTTHIVAALKSELNIP